MMSKTLPGTGAYVSRRKDINLVDLIETRIARIARIARRNRSVVFEPIMGDAASCVTGSAGPATHPPLETRIIRSLLAGLF